MTVENVKTPWITNADASPPVLTSDYAATDRTKEFLGAVVMAASASNGSTYRIGRIPSNAVVTSVNVAVDANSGMTSTKLGVLETAANGGGVAAGVAGADTIFSSAVDLHSGLATLTNQLAPRVAGASASIANYGKRIYELLGLTVDPNRDYDLVFTQTTAGSGGGNLAVKASYLL